MEVSDVRKILSVLGCLLLAAIAIGSPPPANREAEAPEVGPELQPPDWLSSGSGFITHYGAFGYPIAVGFYDDSIFHDEWYPVARSFLDGTTYRTYYSAYGYPIAFRDYDDRIFHDEWYPVARSFLDETAYQTYYYSSLPPVNIDGSWWRDPRGYRPLYRQEPRFVPIFGR